MKITCTKKVKKDISEVLWDGVRKEPSGKKWYRVSNDWDENILPEDLKITDVVYSDGVDYIQFNRPISQEEEEMYDVSLVWTSMALNFIKYRKQNPDPKSKKRKGELHVTSSESTQHDLRMYSDEGYWFMLKHGWGPGTLPSDVEVLDHVVDGYCDYAKLNRFLTTEELNTYDIKEQNPPEELLGCDSMEVVGTEEIYSDSISFDDYCKDVINVNPDELSDSNYDYYYGEYLQHISTEASSSVNADEVIEAYDNESALARAREDWLNPPEYDDPIEDDDKETVIDLYVDSVIDVDDKGNWEWIDDEFLYDITGRFDSVADEETGVTITDGEGLLEDIDMLIVDKVPLREGRYIVEGHVSLAFVISDLEYDYDYDGDRMYNTDKATVEFLPNKSDDNDVTVEPVRM